MATSDDTPRSRADPVDVLRRRTSEKWRAFPPDVLPMFVAEMDFPLAPAIRAALHTAVDLGDTGYVEPSDSGAREAFAAFAADHWGWSPSPDRMGITTDVSVVIAEGLRRLVSPGDGVIITPPVYGPFFQLVPEAGGVVVEVPLLDDGRAHALDLAGIDRAFAAGARAILLCSPHNPLGLVHEREVLVELSRIVARHDATVLADEIHAPLVHHGRAFTPYLTVSDEARDHTIAAHSASKAFNLAGLKTAFFVAESERMTGVIRSLPLGVTFRTGIFGLIATQVAFRDGRAWLDATVAAIEANADLLEAQLAEKLPGVTMRRPEASYLVWLDMTALGWGDDPAAVALERARLALASGPSFGREGRGFARMNIACAPETIVEAVDRLAASR